MAGWARYRGTAVALPLENVDTDQLIPARFMSVPRAEGYGGFLMHDMRGDLAIDRHPGAGVLVARRNFGCGSSREAAVYALVDAGIRAVVAPSFGDIFAGNAANNGLLTAALPAEAVEEMIARLGDHDGPADVDIAARSLTVASVTHAFALDETRALKLLNGWDDIDLTLNSRDAIAGFRPAYPGARPRSEVPARADERPA